MLTKYVYTREEINNILRMLKSPDSENHILAYEIMDRMIGEQRESIVEIVRWDHQLFPLIVWIKLCDLYTMNPCGEIPLFPLKDLDNE